jgi:peptidoglycan/LPS O-acetylase OafA/YrhL
MIAAMYVDFRPRLVVTLATGLAIYAAGWTGWIATCPTNRVIAFAGASSYSLFLIHFPVCLVVNAFLSQFVLHSPALCLMGMLTGYVLSILASIAFYFGVERAFQRERRAPVAIPAAAH